MTKYYYTPCRELDECNELIARYFLCEQYEKCFEGHMELAVKGYPLAECQVGYFYYEGLGVGKDLKKSFYWTKRAAEHGDRDAQNNLAELFYEIGVVVEKDIGEAREWYKKAALSGQTEAQEKCRSLGIEFDADI